MNGQLGKELAEFERQEALLRTITAQKEEIGRLNEGNEKLRADLNKAEGEQLLANIRWAKAKAEVQRLRDALQWYADQNNWARNHGMDAWAIRKERGFRARDALQAPESGDYPRG